MKTLHEGFYQSVVNIESEGTGTGFLIGVDIGSMSNDQNNYFIFLVTNKHVISKNKLTKIIFNQASKTIDLYINPDDKSWVNIPEGLDLAIFHLDAKELQSFNITSQFILENNVITNKSDLLDIGYPGSEVYTLGFPMNITGLKQNYPIVRQGVIARNDLDLLDKNELYLDISNFPGNSGGPIITKQTPNDAPKILGVISAYIPFENKLYDISSGVPVLRSVIGQNSGVAIGIPMHLVYEIAKNYTQNIINQSR